MFYISSVHTALQTFGKLPVLPHHCPFHGRSVSFLHIRIFHFRLLFPSCPHSAVRTTPAPCVTFNRSIPAGCSFFCPPLHTSPHGEGSADRTGPPKAENAHKIRQRPVFLPLPFAQGRALSCGTIFSRKRACRTVPFRLLATCTSSAPAPPLRLEAAVAPC